MKEHWLAVGCGRGIMRVVMNILVGLAISAVLNGRVCASDAPAKGPAQVSFRNDVMAVLAKSGCTAGACHGNKNGKGGFKLSLRGQDPDIDYDVLTRDLSGRRANLL